MTKSKLIRLFEGLEQDTVLYRLYDHYMKQYMQYKAIVEKTGERFFIEEFKCGTITVKMILDKLKQDGVSINDSIDFEDVSSLLNVSYRDIYDDFKNIAKKKEYFAVDVPESGELRSKYYILHKSEIQEYHKNLYRMHGMLANEYAKTYTNIFY